MFLSTASLTLGHYTTPPLWRMYADGPTDRLRASFLPRRSELWSGGNCLVFILNTLVSEFTSLAGFYYLVKPNTG